MRLIGNEFKRVIASGVNRASRSPVGRLCVSSAAAMAFAASCGHTKTRLIHSQTVQLPTGRFAGPIEVEVPRAADHRNRWFKIETQLTAACSPRLRVEYPDGETGSIGADDGTWQALQRARAEASNDEPETASDVDSAPGQAAPGDAKPGRFERVQTESWPGQIEFLRQRKNRCAKPSTYRHAYITGVDETGRLSVWADFPQELDRGSLTVRVHEIIDVEAERRAEKKRERPPRQRRAAAKVRPAKPKPKRETPEPAVVAGATWTPGQWVYSQTRGRWVWVRGSWQRPRLVPALRTEKPGGPPIAGCTWRRGHWVWVSGVGRWDWQPGHWNAPPPKTETPGAPPVPESSWVAGRWVVDGKSFRWLGGHWGKPTPRIESRPAPPFVGARWRVGAWIKVDGAWEWSPGFYEGANRKPPPRKRETPPQKPQADAVWLAGFWRATGTGWRWIRGHWERPPGEGYVWVPDPVDPTAGVSIGGQWKLRVRVDGRGRPRIEVAP